MFQLTKLFSDIGGILGLWIGCSVLSIAELLELLMDLIVLLVYKVTKKPYWGQPSKQRPQAFTRINSSVSSIQETDLDSDRIPGVVVEDISQHRNGMPPGSTGIATHNSYLSRVGNFVTSSMTKLHVNKKRLKRSPSPHRQNRVGSIPSIQEGLAANFNNMYNAGIPDDVSLATVRRRDNAPFKVM